MTAAERALFEVVARRAPAAAVAWLRDAPFAVAFAGAARRTGRAPIEPSDAAAIAAAGLAWPITGVDECARAALVLREVRGGALADPVAFVHDLVRRGDVRERQAVLRALAALPEPARFAAVAIDACRTNVRTVFDAIACDNAFVAHLPDDAFHQLVLKALFVGAPVARIVGLSGRRTAELVRMVEAYASERRAAGRAVPADAALVLRPGQGGSP